MMQDVKGKLLVGILMIPVRRMRLRVRVRVGNHLQARRRGIMDLFGGGSRRVTQ